MSSWTHRTFAPALLAWFARHGRHDLPWQRDPTPYRVWISEVMLQQTQVAVVIPYFERFVTHFPDLATLAAAPLDEVLHVWSGLGYYARARHLHQAAQQACHAHGGHLPADRAQLQALPGIGRSTAAAILSLAHGQRQAILDGNCKRVLARCFAVPGWPGTAPVQRQLWDLAERLTPLAAVADYNQAMMDLGATCCTRAQPGCDRCPLAAGCQAYRQGRVADYPAARPRRRLPVRQTRLLLIADPSGAVLLQRRPPAGIWGGLYVPPVIAADADPAAWCREQLGLPIRRVEMLPLRRHSFTHFQLDIEPVALWLTAAAASIGDSDWCWADPRHPGRLGLPTPIKALLIEFHGISSQVSANRSIGDCTTTANRAGGSAHRS
ncbi:MAG: A/G-specific adenine glycosylase [Chromatiaceae bacterium]|nr:MAG: A/G-specific adenine glycosylase [Chromatiaceae bacterium]